MGKKKGKGQGPAPRSSSNSLSESANASGAPAPANATQSTPSVAASTSPAVPIPIAAPVDIKSAKVAGTPPTLPKSPLAAAPAAVIQMAGSPAKGTTPPIAVPIQPALAKQSSPAPKPSPPVGKPIPLSTKPPPMASSPIAQAPVQLGSSPAKNVPQVPKAKPVEAQSQLFSSPVVGSPGKGTGFINAPVKLSDIGITPITFPTVGSPKTESKFMSPIQQHPDESKKEGFKDDQKARPMFFTDDKKLSPKNQKSQQKSPKVERKGQTQEKKAPDSPSPLTESAPKSPIGSPFASAIKQEMKIQDPLKTVPLLSDFSQFLSNAPSPISKDNARSMQPDNKPILPPFIPQQAEKPTFDKKSTPIDISPPKLATPHKASPISQPPISFESILGNITSKDNAKESLQKSAADIKLPFAEVKSIGKEIKSVADPTPTQPKFTEKPQVTPFEKPVTPQMKEMPVTPLVKDTPPSESAKVIGPPLKFDEPKNKSDASQAFKKIEEIPPFIPFMDKLSEENKSKDNKPQQKPEIPKKPTGLKPSKQQTKQEVIQKPKTDELDQLPISAPQTKADTSTIAQKKEDKPDKPSTQDVKPAKEQVTKPEIVQVATEIPVPPSPKVLPSTPLKEQMPDQSKQSPAPKKEESNEKTKTEVFKKEENAGKGKDTGGKKGKNSQKNVTAEDFLKSRTLSGSESGEVKPKPEKDNTKSQQPDKSAFKPEKNAPKEAAPPPTVQEKIVQKEDDKKSSESTKQAQTVKPEASKPVEKPSPKEEKTDKVDAKKKDEPVDNISPKEQKTDVPKGGNAQGKQQQSQNNDKSNKKEKPSKESKGAKEEKESAKEEITGSPPKDTKPQQQAVPKETKPPQQAPSKETKQQQQKPKEDKQSATPTKEQKPKDDKQSIPSTKEQKPREDKQSTSPTKEQKPKEDKQSTPPTKEQKPKEDKQSTPPTKEQKPKEDKQSTPPTKEQKPKEDKQSTPPTKEQKSKDDKQSTPSQIKEQKPKEDKQSTPPTKEQKEKPATKANENDKTKKEQPKSNKAQDAKQPTEKVEQISPDAVKDEKKPPNKQQQQQKKNPSQDEIKTQGKQGPKDKKGAEKLSETRTTSESDKNAIKEKTDNKKNDKSNQQQPKAKPDQKPKGNENNKPKAAEESKVLQPSAPAKKEGSDEEDLEPNVGDTAEVAAAKKKRRRKKKNKKPAESAATDATSDKPKQPDNKEGKSQKKTKENQQAQSKPENQQGTKTEKSATPKTEKIPAVPAEPPKATTLNSPAPVEPKQGEGQSQDTAQAKKKKNKKKKKQGAAGEAEDSNDTQNDPAGQKKTPFEFRPSKMTVNPLAHHLSNCCCICKATSGNNQMPLQTCTACSLACYCSREHQIQHWPDHKELCNYVSSVLSKERPYFFTPAEKLSQDERRHFRLSELQLLQKALNRNPTPLESALILHPRACYTCYKPAFQNTCPNCYCINYCCIEHLPQSHKEWCSTLHIKLLFIQSQIEHGSAGISVPRPTKNLYPLNSNMKVYLESLDLKSPQKMPKELYLSHISELATYPLTLLHALQLLSTQGATNPLDYEHLVVHVVGAEDVYECCQILKWKYFFVNLLPNLKTLHLVFIGCELTIEDEHVHVEGRLVYEFHAKMTYLDYCRKCYIKPSIICAFNSGLYRNTGFQGNDSWGPSLCPMLKVNPGAPVLLTAYTHMESQLDLQRVKEMFLNSLKVVQLPLKNPFASIFPNHNLVSESECPVAFRNYYLTIVRHA